MKFGARKPYTDVLGMNPTGFEWYVCGIFNELPGWTAFQPTKTNAKDFSADVYAISPYGTKYVIQCKHFLSPNSKVGAKDVGYLAGTLPKHQAAFGIFITAHDQEESSEDANYTREAKELASSNGIRLWGLKELSELVEAGQTGLAHYLINLGLEAQAPQPPIIPPAENRTPTTTLPMAQPKSPRRSMQTWPWLILAVLTAALGWLSRDTYNAVANGLDAKAVAVEKLIRSYEVAYRDDLNYGRARSSGTYMDALLYEDFSAILDARVNQNCNLATDELSPTQINRIEWLGNELARVQAMRHWKQQLTCANGTSRVLVNGFVEIEYTVSLVDIDGKKRWIVVNASRI